jgi:cytidylate kinase
MAIITISRGTFSGGLMLAEDLSRALGYKDIGREEIVETASKKYGVSEDKLLKAILKGPSAFQRFTYEREQYLAYMQAVLCEHARADNMIYHGNAGHFLLKGIPHVLRVRIVAPMELRIKFVMERQQLLHDEAIKYIEKVDKQRIKWTKFLYGVDWRSPELYDIVFNLETENIHFISSMIQYAVQQEPFKTTPHSQKVMDDLTLGSLVRAAIASDPETRNAEITARADGGTVEILGNAKQKDMIDRMSRIAATVPGVKEVKNKVALNYRYQQVDT